MPAPAFPRRGARRRVAGRSQFMAANEESLRSILQRNPSLQREQFQVESLDVEDKTNIKHIVYAFFIHII